VVLFKDSIYLEGQLKTGASAFSPGTTLEQQRQGTGNAQISPATKGLFSGRKARRRVLSWALTSG